MKKKLFSLLIVFVIALGMGAPAFAQQLDLIMDNQGLLWDEASLELQAQEVYDKHGLAVVYLSTDSLQGLTGAELAERLYSEYVAVPDGVLLLDCAEASSYYIYYAGAGLDIFEGADSTTMISAFSSSASYDQAVRAYLETADAIIADRSGGTRNLVLLDDLSQPDSQYQPDENAEQPLLLLDDSAPQTQMTQSPEIPAQRQLPLIVDTAGVIDPARVAALNDRADALSKKYACDTAVVFISSTGGRSIQAYADDFYDYNGYGYGTEDAGILLMVAVEDRSFALSTYGPAAYTFSDYGQLYMDEAYIPCLRNSDWAGAAEAYLQVCQELLEYELEHGRPYDMGNQKQESFIGAKILLSLVIGFVLAFIPIGVMKRKMLNVRKQEDAADYLKSGSFHLSRNYDRYITSQVTRVAKPKENNNSRSGGGGGSSFHVSSSGRSHGGHSGRF